jgi:ABC-type Na+ efflux pump permease subunit
VERMKTASLKIKNAIKIRTRNILVSPAIRFTLVIAFIASLCVSFFPLLRKLFTSDRTVVASNVALSLEDSFDFDLVSDRQQAEKSDILVLYENDIFTIEVLTQKGYSDYLTVIDKVNRLNVEEVLNNADIRPDILSRLAGSNIIVNIDKDVTQLDDSIANFIMMLTFIFFFVMTLLITRIGVQVAFEKNNKVTETILTSISREQLYFSQVVSSTIVTALSFISAGLPIIAAYLIKDPDLATDFSFFTASGVALFLFHIVFVSAALVMCSIAIGSMVRHGEDANTMTVIVMLPIMVSYIYYIVTLDIFKGALTFLNYIPFLGLFPAFGGILRGSFSILQTVMICVTDVAFFAAIYIAARRIYCRRL